MVAKISPVSGVHSLEAVYISSKKTWVPNIIEVWRHKLLLLVLIKRNIKLRYKQTVLGILWVIIQPLALSGVFTIVFGKLMVVQTNNTAYMPFVLTGVLIWQFFSRSLSDASTSLIGFSNVITKVYFPRVLIPTASILTALVDLIIIFPLILLVLWLLNDSIPLHSIWVTPCALIMTFIIALGLSLFFSSINVIFRDIQHLIPFMLQLGLYLSPVVYASSTIPEKWRWLFILNPFVGIIDTFRYGLLPEAPMPSLISVATSFGVGFVSIIIGAITFSAIEQVMIDRI